MSLDNARYALEVFVERLEVDLERKGMGGYQRAQWESQLKAAKAGLATLDVRREVVLSEVCETLARQAAEADRICDFERRNWTRDIACTIEGMKERK